MKQPNFAAALGAALFAVCLMTTDSFAQKSDVKAGSGSNRVKLYSDAIELIEISDKTEKCPAEGGATSVKLRVKSASPVDVRIYYTNRKGHWASTDFLSKKAGDEIFTYDCHPKAKYKVQTRPAGSEKWPSQ